MNEHIYIQDQKELLQLNNPNEKKDPPNNLTLSTINVYNISLFTTHVLKVFNFKKSRRNLVKGKLPPLHIQILDKLPE